MLIPPQHFPTNVSRSPVACAGPKQTADIMWFITEFLERTTRTFARTVLKVAQLETEAQRKALSEARARRALTGGLILPERALCVPASLALEPRVVPLEGELPEPQSALAHLAEATIAADREAAALAAAKPGDVLAAIAHAGSVVGTFEEPLTVALEIAGKPLPVGVRGDVISRYLSAFALTSGAENAALIEKLRKDKKVRVAELQLIAAQVLGTEIVMRKKGEHLEALRRQLVPVERRRAAPAEFAIHAN